MTSWLQEQEKVMMNSRSIALNVELVKVKGHQVNRGWGHLVNEIAKKAFFVGADYLYLVADDTEFFERWPELFVGVVRGGPGVARPSAVISGGDSDISSHEFVHRTHMNIFNLSFYPTQLSDEYTRSSWMAAVYGTKRTFKASAVRVSAWTARSPRVDDRMLERSVWRGRSAVSKWLGSLTDHSTHSPESMGHQLVDKPVKHPQLVVECDAAGVSLSKRAKYCAKARRKHNVTPRKAKESMNKAQLLTWRANHCGDMFHATQLRLPSGVPSSGRRKGTTATTFHLQPIPDCLNESMSHLAPLIAVISASTSRNEGNASCASLSVFTLMLPSLIRSLDCGFRYMVVIGYDVGDKFYDSDQVRDTKIPVVQSS